MCMALWSARWHAWTNPATPGSEPNLYGSESDMSIVHARSRICPLSMRATSHSIVYPGQITQLIKGSKFKNTWLREGIYGLKQPVLFCLVVRGFTLPTPLVVWPLKKNTFFMCVFPKLFVLLWGDLSCFIVYCWKIRDHVKKKSCIKSTLMTYRNRWKIFFFFRAPFKKSVSGLLHCNGRFWNSTFLLLLNIINEGQINVNFLLF